MNALVNFEPLLLANLQSGDYVGFTFFIGSMAMLAATVFFFFQYSQVEPKWKDSLLVSGLITFIAAVHYYYMRDFWATTGSSPTEFRYIDWILTVPLMCVEFYLITKKAGGTIGLLWKLIFASVVMLVTGYIGEAVYGDVSASWIWGFISGLAYFYILYLVMFGEVKALAEKAGPKVAKAVKILAWFVLVGWAIYPIGYIAGTEGGLFGMKVLEGLSMDIVYNIGDAINKIGFGLVIYALAVSND
ncbi:MAG: bacteriorhodopsin-like [Saprospiraceae bacterium]